VTIARQMQRHSVCVIEPDLVSGIRSSHSPAVDAGVGSTMFLLGWSAPMSLLKWAIVFLIFAGIAGLLGFTGIAAGAEDISKFLFFVFLVVFAVIGIMAVTAFKTVT
jgi:uncharacterized membrane protein YtjA (UPF0391 family)